MYIYFLIFEYNMNIINIHVYFIRFNNLSIRVICL